MIKADLSEPMYFEHDMSINVSYGHYYSHFPTHWHSYMEIVAPLSNDMTMTLGNETYTLTKNQIVLVPPRSLHSLTKKVRCPAWSCSFPICCCRSFMTLSRTDSSYAVSLSLM
ncbi:MAG: cupin domain-containing protein [Blautia coccoides]